MTVYNYHTLRDPHVVREARVWLMEQEWLHPMHRELHADRLLTAIRERRWVEVSDGNTVTGDLAPFALVRGAGTDDGLYILTGRRALTRVEDEERLYIEDVLFSIDLWGEDYEQYVAQPVESLAYQALGR